MMMKFTAPGASWPAKWPRPPAGVGSVDVMQTIEQALLRAGLDPKPGGLMQGVTQTLRRAFASTGSGAGGFAPPHVPPASAATEAFVDVIAREVGPGDLPSRPVRPPADAPVRPGQFVSGTHTNPAGTRAYKLYVPSSYTGREPVPLLVMLHGCTQSPDDFATGTRMNELAEQHGFLVVYPAQASHANSSGCWNWFKPQDQGRDQGEPAVIAGLTREVAASHAVDPRRIFVAGLSAGAAMAVVLGETYPELFAAVGAHSGLPYAAAHDVPSAFAAMKGGHGLRAGLPPLPGAAAPRRATVSHAVPTIVFHGDQDKTVDACNGTQIVAQANTAAAVDVRAQTQQGKAPGGRSFSRTLYTDAHEQVRVEQWLLHGAGHAWSGGSASGSYTDPTGPDASAEMVRFFLSQRKAGTA